MKDKIKEFRLISKDQHEGIMPCGNTGLVVTEIFSVGMKKVLKRNSYSCSLCGLSTEEELV